MNFQTRSKLVVFYNGKDNIDDKFLELKDVFQNSSVSPDIQVRVRMLNINYDPNKKLLEACRPLAEYAWLIRQIQEYSDVLGIDSAVDRALDEMPGDFLIRDFLIGNRAEVKQMCITEYNEAETMELFKEEGRLEGKKEGRKEGIQGAVALLKEMDVPISDILLKIQKKYGLSPEESEKFL